MVFTPLSSCSKWLKETLGKGEGDGAVDKVPAVQAPGPTLIKKKNSRAYWHVFVTSDLKRK